MPACAVDKGVEQLAEHSCIAVVECAVNQSIYNTLYTIVAVVYLLLGLVSCLDSVYLLNSCAEDILILPACFLNDLNVSAVIGSKSNCAVEHKLHVACT